MAVVGIEINGESVAVGAWRAYRGLRLWDGYARTILFFKKMTVGSLSRVSGDFACLA